VKRYKAPPHSYHWGMKRFLITLAFLLVAITGAQVAYKPAYAHCSMGQFQARFRVGIVEEALMWLLSSMAVAVAMSLLAASVYFIWNDKTRRWDHIARSLVYSLSPATTTAEISAKTLPAGYAFEWTGTAYQEQKASGHTPIILGLALLFAYLFLVVLYESWTIPVPCCWRRRSPLF
jgi:hypothetical protein